jgi:elongation factor G
MSRNLNNIRNIGIIAHIDAGKTTVTERMLFLSGAKHRVGKVDEGTTETDSDVEEQERGITIYSACVTFPWKDVVVNLLDTPGHVDFTAEVERCLRVLDGVVVVFSAREGVEAQSETVWRQADKYRVPRIAFINKMDREGADFEAVYREIERRLSGTPIAVQVPVGQGPQHVADPFRGVIDLIAWKMRTFSRESEGKEVIETDIPEDLVDYATLWRESMLERLYNYSNELMELALQEEPIGPELIRRELRRATLHRQVHPVLCGSALHGIGVQSVLDAAAWYLPSPADLPPVAGIDPTQTDMTIKRAADPAQPFSALVFKVLPAKTGDLYWVRVYSGELKANSRAYNPRLDKKENVAQLWHIHATKKEQQVPQAEAGDIVGVIGPRESITGDTLCDPKHPILLESIRFPETVIAMAIEPETSSERKKLADVLEMLKRQDPTFQAVENPDTGQTLISGMGELHLEVIKHKLLRDFSLNVKVHKPRVSYRETIAEAAEVTGECHRQHAGQSLFAKVTIAVEPWEDSGGGVVVINRCPPGSLDESYLTAALETLRARAEGGGMIGGFPLSRIRVTLRGGQAHEVQSSEMAFRIAADDAFTRGLTEGGPVVLEPVMKLEIGTPDEFLGDIVGDLQQRRAIIVRTENREVMSVIEAHAPLRELFGYSSAIRSLSQGRASFTMEPLKYASAPQEVAQGFGL